MLPFWLLTTGANSPVAAQLAAVSVRPVLPIGSVFPEATVIAPLSSTARRLRRKDSRDVIVADPGVDHRAVQ